MFEMFKMYLILLSSFLALVAAAVPEPKIALVKFSGNGCPQRTVDSATSAFNTTTNSVQIWQGYGEFMPFYGGQATDRDRKKSCTPTWNITVDPGYKVRVGENGTIVNGYVKLEYTRHDMAVMARYIFREDLSYESQASVRVSGPVNGRFGYLIYAGGAGTGVESKCGGGQLMAELSASILATNGQGLGKPAISRPDEDDWYFQTDVEVLPCE